ncbi:MAG: DUF4173 domain-containing protein [Pyrinomonadaceae bacterium]
MNDRTKIGLQILQVAVIIGVAGDVLLRQMPWGLNVLLFNVIFAAAMIMLLRRHAPEQLTRHTVALFGAQIFFAAMFVWRDAGELLVADALAIITILSVLFLPRIKVPAQIAGAFHYVVGFIWSALNAAFAPAILLSSDIKWSNMPRTGWRKHALATARGLAIAAPFILIFGGLFMAADAAYEGLVQRVFNIMPETVFTHVLLFSIFAWLSAGYLRGVLMNPVDSVESIITSVVSATETGSKVANLRNGSGEHPVTLPDNKSVVDHLNTPETPDNVEARASARAEDTPQNKVTSSERTWSWANIDNSIMPTAFTLGTVEIGVIFGLVNLLFLSFVIVQVPYLFGGMELVQNTPDFKLAEYARRGFGELVAVSAIVLPMLLVSHWLIRKETRTAENLFRTLAGVQIALLFVIMASAVQRIVLLTGNLGYGMTTVRLYPLIFMTWLAIVFVLFAATVLRGARQHFAWAALWSAFFILGATHVFNPDEFIVRHNLALMREGREFDAPYNSNLSYDAIPVLVDSFADLNIEDQVTALRAIAWRNCRMKGEADLRSWNYSRSQVRSVLNNYDTILQSQTPVCYFDGD